MGWKSQGRSGNISDLPCSAFNRFRIFRNARVLLGQSQKNRPVKLLCRPMRACEPERVVLCWWKKRDVRIKTKRREMGMKIQMIVHIKNDDGTFVADSTAIEVDVPNYEAFTGPENFGEVFDRYERKVLEARNDVVKSATEKYLDGMTQKKHSQ